MSETYHLSLQPAPGVPELDRHILEFLEKIRHDIVQLLQPDETTARPAAADLLLGLQSLKVAAETAWRLAVNAGVVAEKERVWAETKKIKAETERVESERVGGTDGLEAWRVMVEEKQQMVAELQRQCAEKDGIIAEMEMLAQSEKETGLRERMLAEKHEINSRSDILIAQKEQVWAETARIHAETEKIKGVER